MSLGKLLYDTKHFLYITFQEQRLAIFKHYFILYFESLLNNPTLKKYHLDSFRSFPNL